MFKDVREGSFAVFGLSTFGAHCAQALYRGGAIVLAIDQDVKIIDRISPHVTVAAKCDVLDEASLQELGAFDMKTAVVALHHHFDTAVLLTHMLRQRGVHDVLVQVNSDREASAIQAVGATGVIFPERDMAEEVARKLVNPSLADQVHLDENFAIIDVPCPPSFVGQSLQELDIRKKYNVTVVALRTLPTVEAPEGSFQPAPPPDMPLEPDHHLLLLGHRKTLFKFKTALQLD